MIKILNKTSFLDQITNPIPNEFRILFQIITPQKKLANFQERIITELNEFNVNRKYLFYAKPAVVKKTGAALKDIKCGFPGPDTPLYKNSYFEVKLSFTNKYPYSPPRVKFLNSCFHPNIYPDGLCCLNILQNLWKPSYSIMNVLCSLQFLLQKPNFRSPANTRVAEYQHDKEGYERRVIDNIYKKNSLLTYLQRFK